MMTFVINILMIIFAPFLMIGIIKKTKAFWAGRKGASIVQPLFDFLRLMKKDSVYSNSTSWVFQITPVINLSVILLASLFVPLIQGSILNIPFAFIIFSYVLGFSKFFSLISALDTASSFEGMGASREACFSTIVEPAFFIIMATITALTGVTNFDNLKFVLQDAGGYGYFIVLLTVLALLIMLLVECSRVPVDDPATHLELTMIHEVMILDNSGVDLGLILYSSMLKMFLLSSIIASLLIPLGLSLIASATLFVAIIFGLSVLVGTIESSIARFRLTHVFEFIFIMSILALLILTLVTYRIYGS